MGPYQDFIRMFNKIHVCRLFPPSWHQLTIKGAWVGKTAGGAPSHKGRTSGSWCNNPQYHLTVSQPCSMVISLMQRDSRVAFGQRLAKVRLNPPALSTTLSSHTCTCTHPLSLRPLS